MAKFWARVNQLYLLCLSPCVCVACNKKCCLQQNVLAFIWLVAFKFTAPSVRSFADQSWQRYDLLLSQSLCMASMQREPGYLCTAIQFSAWVEVLAGHCKCETRGIDFAVCHNVSKGCYIRRRIFHSCSRSMPCRFGQGCRRLSTKSNDCRLTTRWHVHGNEAPKLEAKASFCQRGKCDKRTCKRPCATCAMLKWSKCHACPLVDRIW